MPSMHSREVGIGDLTRKIDVPNRTGYKYEKRFLKIVTDYIGDLTRNIDVPERTGYTYEKRFQKSVTDDIGDLTRKID